MKKRLAFLLATILVLTALFLPASAEEEAVIGYSETLIEKKDLSFIPDIKNFADGYEYKITDAAGLVYFSHLVNDGNMMMDTTIYLANDIDMSGVTTAPAIDDKYDQYDKKMTDVFWPIGYNYPCEALNKTGPTNRFFCGIFDGQGHTIDGLVFDTDIRNNTRTDSGIADTSEVEIGLFGTIVSGTVKNLVIGSSCSITDSFHNDGGTVTDGATVGLVAGKIVSGTCLISNIYNAGSIRKTMGFAGGLIGYIGTPGVRVTIGNCTNAGEVTGSHVVGGLVGMATNNITVSFINCRNLGDVSLVPNYGAYEDVGNFVAKFNLHGMGGILGRQGGGTTNITNCINNGKIEGYFCVGGFTGLYGGTCTVVITGSKNYGQIVAKTLESKKVNSGEFMAMKASTVTIDGSEITDSTGIGTHAAGTDLTLLPVNGGFAFRNITGLSLSGTTDLKNYAALSVTDRGSVNTWRITDAAGLSALADAVNGGDTFAGKTVLLANDIDMTGVNFTPIGYAESDTVGDADKTDPAHAFAGTFDGLGHVIDKLTVKNESEKIFTATGLFGIISGGTVKNLILGKNCSVTVASKNTDAARVLTAGAVAGILINGKVENCLSEAVVSGARYSGLIGSAIGNCRLTGCTNAGNVDALQYAGGMVGVAADLTLSHCRNTAKIDRTSGNALGSDPAGAGGMLGRAKGNVSVDACVNDGDVSGSAYAAGLVAIADEGKTLTIRDSFHFGKAESKDDLLQNAADAFCALCKGTAAKTGNYDLTGVKDLTNISVSYVFDPTPYKDPEEEKPPVEVDTSKETEKDTSSATEAKTSSGTTEKATSGSETDTEPTGEKSGCGSAMTSVAGILLLSGLATLISKKRK